VLCDPENTFQPKLLHINFDCHCLNVQLLFILFLHRWSYGVVLYEIFTIGNILSIRYFDGFSAQFGKRNRNFPENELLQHEKMFKKKTNKNTLKIPVVIMFQLQMFSH